MAFFFSNIFFQPFPKAFPNKKRDLSPHIYLPPKKKQETNHFFTVDGGNPKQPPGMVHKTLVNHGYKLPSPQLGERRISSHQSSYPPWN